MYKYTNIWTCNYATSWVDIKKHKYANMQICKYTNIQKETYTIGNAGYARWPPVGATFKGLLSAWGPCALRAVAGNCAKRWTQPIEKVMAKVAVTADCFLRKWAARQIGGDAWVEHLEEEEQ